MAENATPSRPGAGCGAVLLAAAGGLAWIARVVHVGTLDALALADKVATPDPVSALDWPELHVKAIVPQRRRQDAGARPDHVQA